MAVKNPVFLVIALFFFALSAYFLFTSPDEELLASSSSSKPPHPCPYADVLGLDENSPNPHGEGGSLPPIFDAKKFDAAHHDETNGQGVGNKNAAENNKHEEADEHRGRRSDFDMNPHIPHQEYKQEL